MSDVDFETRSAEGIAHVYHEKLIAFEHKRSDTSSPATEVVLFIGGLGDNICTVPYPSVIAKRLPPSWSLAEVMISSSGTGWGTGSLRRDAREIAQAVNYFRVIEKRNRVVLMGHSTGCQDVMQYLAGNAIKNHPLENYEPSVGPAVQGAILQAPVSDRQGMEVTGYDKELQGRAVKLADEWMKTGKGEDVLPLEVTSQLFDTVPVCARRFLSLTQPRGADDFFSTDLPDEVLKSTFGRISLPTRVCIIYSGNDEYAPPGVDKLELITKWGDHVNMGGGDFSSINSGVVEGASHSLREEGQEKAVEECVGKVLGFINWLSTLAPR